MSKDLSAKYYQSDKEILQKKIVCERYHRLSKKETIWSWVIQKSTRRWKTKADLNKKVENYKLKKFKKI